MTDREEVLGPQETARERVARIVADAKKKAEEGARRREELAQYVRETQGMRTR